ncbi:RNP-1 like RNA-binding protein [Calothrix sp. NIES-4071]|nr:RNP-1 like RNA-binding protein [Calothrix sp. NIES-4071]BAZ54739.1 RNP-1 like RNA-binding protein [Calothrix sp. NIES-4105]
MLEVAGLPIQITKSDLDELFLPYGKIQITKNSIVIKIENTQSIAYVELDKNENAAREQLDRKLWRGQSLRVDQHRGDGLLVGQPESRGTGNNNSGNKSN